MLGLYRGWRATQKIVILGLMLMSLGWSAPALALPFLSGAAPKKIAETSPPEVIQTLRPALEKYQPQVTIVSPKANTVLADDTVTVQLQVKDLPLFKDAKLGLGPHLHVFLDDQPYQAVYDASQPLILKAVTPGTHTLRAFASRPWHESFKNEGAYAQTTFHVFTKTPTQNPEPNLPLLTYSRPQGSYGAEPIMLDFYLTNAPLHIVAQEDKADDVPDWRIQVTVNGDRFILDRWEPVYLQGFKPGKNWLQIEYIDEQGHPVPNVYNNTARLVNYTPGGKDALAQLVRGELTAEQAMGIVDPNYVPSPVGEPVPTPASTPVPTPNPSPMPTLAPAPTSIEKEPDKPLPVKAPPPTPKVPAPEVEIKPAPKAAAPKPPGPPADPAPPSAAAEPVPEIPGQSLVEQVKAKASGLFDRFRQTTPQPPAVSPADPGSRPVEIIPTPAASTAPTPAEAAPRPARSRFRSPASPQPEATPTPRPAVPEVAPDSESLEPTASTAEKSRSVENFFDRFRPARPAPKASPAPTDIPAVIEAEPPVIEAEPPAKISKKLIERPPAAPSPVASPAPESPVTRPTQPAAVPPAASPKRMAPKQTAFDRLRRSPLNTPVDQPAPAPRVAPTTPDTAPTWMFPTTQPQPAFTDSAPTESKNYRVPPPRSRPLPTPGPQSPAEPPVSAPEAEGTAVQD